MTNPVSCHKKNKNFRLCRQINIALFIVFVFSCLFLPNGTWHLKQISFLMLIVFNLPTILNANQSSYEDRYILLYSFGYGLFIILISVVVRGGSVVSVLERGYACFIMLLFFILKRYRINLLKIIIAILSLMAGLLIVSALLDAVGAVDIYSNIVLMWLRDSDNAMIGKDIVSIFYYLLFIKTSPLLLVLFLWGLHERKWFFAFLGFAGIILSGTRANVLMAIFAFYLYVLFCEKDTIFKRIIIVGSVITLLVFGTYIFSYLENIFTLKASSDLVRKNHFESVLRVFSSNPSAILWGTGLNSSFYSTGINQFTTTIELSYWDFLRQVGLIGLIPFLWFLINPLIKLAKNDSRWLSIAFFCFLIISYTNPFLYNSTGYLFYLVVYYALHFEREKSFYKASLKEIILVSFSVDTRFLSFVSTN
jgi:hypothetical protein